MVSCSAFLRVNDLSVKTVSSVSSAGVSLSERVSSFTLSETHSSSSFQTFEMVSTVETSTTSVQSVDVRLQTSRAEASPRAPALIVRMSDVIVSLGEMAEFSCSFDGQPLTEIVWDHNGETVVRTERVQCLEDGEVLSLVILSVQLADQGSYCCTVKNRHGQNHTSARLTVEAKEATPQAETPVTSESVSKSEHYSSKSEYESSTEASDQEKQESVQSAGTLLHPSGLKRAEKWPIYRPPNFPDVAALVELGINAANELQPEFLVKIPPEILTKQKESVSPYCVIRGTLSPYVVWLQNHQVLEESRSYSPKHDGPLCCLNLTNTGAKHGGTYTYQIIKAAGDNACSSLLRLENSVPKVEEEHKEEVKAFSSSSISTQEDSYTTSLHVKKDKGKTFELEPESKFYSETMTRQIEKPVFVTKLSSAIATVGNTAKFTVIISGFPKPIVQWFYNKQIITSSSVYTFVEERDEYTLVINDIRKELEGEYSCTASNRLGKSTCTSYLHVKVKDTKDVEEPVAQPPYFIKPIEPMQCTVGGNAVFEYRVTGVPLPSVQWLKDSCHIQPGKFCNMVNNVDGSGFLKIINVQQNDSGLYSCRASNLRGEASCSADLIVVLDTVSISQTQFERKKTTYESSVYEQTSEQTSESNLVRVNLPGQTTSSLEKHQQMIYSSGTEDRKQSVEYEQLGTLSALSEFKVSSAAMHVEQVTRQAAVLQSHQMQEGISVAATQPPAEWQQPAVVTPLKELHMAAITPSIQECQGFTEQHSDPIKSPEVVDVQIFEEQPSKVMSAISESVTPLTIVKAEPLTSMEGERVRPIPESKHAISSHQVETRLVVLKEQHGNIPFPEEEKAFRIKEGVKVLQSLVTSENLELTQPCSSTIPTVECSKCLEGKEQSKPVLASFSEIKHTLSKESCFEVPEPVEEVAQLSKDQVLKSAISVKETYNLKADQIDAIAGLDSAVLVHSQREENQVLHLQVISDQGTLPSEGRFTCEKPEAVQAESRKSPNLMYTTSVDDQKTVKCEQETTISCTKAAEVSQVIKPCQEAPPRLHLSSVQAEAILSKEGLLSMQEPNQQMAVQKQEKARKQAVSVEEKTELTADYTKHLDVSVKGVSPEHRKEPQTLNVLHVVSESTPLPKESPIIASAREQHALVQKEDNWNILHAMTVSDRPTLQEGHTDDLEATEELTSKVTVEPKLPMQPLNVEEKAISTESSVTLADAEQDFAVQIQEGQSLRQSVLMEEKRPLTSEVSKDITKPETSAVSMVTQPPATLQVTESQQSQTLPKELTFMIPVPKSHSLEIKHQLKNALQCAVACDQPLILADVVRILEVVDVKEVKVLKEPKNTMFSYLITTKSFPVEVTIAFEGEYPRTADLRSELQAALSSIIYQEQQIFLSEQVLDTSQVFQQKQKVQLSFTPSKEVLSPVVESVQLTENVDVITSPKTQIAALKTESTVTSGKVDVQKTSIQTAEQDQKSLAIKGYKKDVQVLETLMSDISLVQSSVEESRKVFIHEEERIEEFLKVETTKVETTADKKDKEPKFELSLEDISAMEGSVVTFSVKIKHVNKVNWLFNGKLIKSGKEFKCSKDHDTYTLVISKVTKEKHEGEYTCQAANQAAEASTSSRLTVLSRGCIMGILFFHHNSTKI